MNHIKSMLSLFKKFIMADILLNVSLLMIKGLIIAFPILRIGT